MTWQYTPYIWPLAISTVVAWTVAVYMWRRRDSAPGALPVFALLVSAGIWSSIYALQMAAGDLEGKYFWLKVVYLGITPICTLWLLFAMAYAGRLPRNRNLLWLLAVEPILVQIAVWTNPYHQSFWTKVEVIPSISNAILVTSYGSWFWIHAAYSYLLLIIGMIVLIQLMLRTSHLYRYQIAAIIFGIVLPWLGNVIYLFGLNPFGKIDLSPFSFTLAGSSIAWGLFHSKLFEAIPIARDSLIASMKEAVLVTDLHKRLLFTNPASQTFFGEHITQERGQTISELSPTIGRALEHLAENTRTEIELRKDDVTHTCELYHKPLYNRHKHLAGHLIVLDNINEKKQVEKRMADLETEAEQANRAKSTFLANMSHEMRTPLNAILGYTQILEDAQDLPEKHRRSLASIGQSSTHLLKLIEDVLYLSKIDAGQAEVNRIDFDLSELLKALNNTFQQRCHDQNLNWRMTTDSAPKYVVGDGEKLHQVLLNLLDNAVKFTPKGEITFRVENRDDHQLYFEVTDTGPGISYQDQLTILQPFQQDIGDTSQGGQGLGLTIAARQIELMGGELLLESNEGQGAQFYFTLHLPPGQPPKLQLDTIDWSLVQNLADGYAVNALIVDADMQQREKTVQLLSQIGATTQTAANGEEALQAVEKQRPDIIFTDIQMPILDGPQMLQKLFESHGQKSPVVIAITDTVFDHQRQHYLDMGFRDLFDKPMRAEQIYACLVQQLNVEYDFAKEGEAEQAAKEFDLATIVLPEDLYQNLMLASETHNVTAMRRQVKKLEEMGDREQYLGQQLNELIEQYNLGGIKDLLIQTKTAE